MLGCWVSLEKAGEKEREREGASVSEREAVRAGPTIGELGEKTRARCVHVERRP